MATHRANFRGFAFAVNRGLWARQAAGGFDGGTQNDRHSGGYSAQNSPVAISLRFDAIGPALAEKQIVIVAAAHCCAAKADAVLDAQYGGQTQECFAQI